MVDYYRGIEKPWREFGATESEWKNPEWQRANFIKDPHELARHIDLTKTQISMIDETIKHGKRMRVSPYAVSLMLGEGRSPLNVNKQGNSTSDRVHPLFMRYVKMPDQYLFGGGTADPLGDDKGSFGRITQRYVDRLAYFSNSSANCDGFCNWCQRDRHLSAPSRRGTKDVPEFEYIRDNVNIGEVLETGGDALTLSDEQLEHDLKKLSEMRRKDPNGKSHPMQTIRIATGVLSTNPFAATPEKLRIIRKYMKSPENLDFPMLYATTHFVSLPELTETAQRYVLDMKDCGLTVKNQAVLLKGVNDDFETMSRLCRDIFDMGIEPYYIFQCHKRSGCEAAIVPINEGVYIAAELWGQKGGSSRVTYAVNLADRGGKVVLTPQGIGSPYLQYRREYPLWNCKTKETVMHEGLLRVKERDFRKGTKAMSIFLGDESIAEYVEDGKADGLPMYKTKSNKYRPSMLVVADDNPRNVVFVTNITEPKPMTNDEKGTACGYFPNGPELRHPYQQFVTDIAPLADRYMPNK